MTGNPSTVLAPIFKFKKSDSDRGTDIHAICEFYDQGDLDLGSVDKTYMGYLDSYMKLLALFKPTWQKIEWRVYHPVLLYPGTIDRYGLLGGRRTVLDIKSGVLGAGGQQTAAYAMAIDQGHYQGIRRVCWRLKKDGKIGSHHEYDDPADYINWLTKLSEWRANNA